MNEEAERELSHWENGHRNAYKRLGEMFAHRKTEDAAYRAALELYCKFTGRTTEDIHGHLEQQELAWGQSAK
jgi:hypothetical protein